MADPQVFGFELVVLSLRERFLTRSVRTTNCKVNEHMIPRAITHQLAKLRRRETLLRLSWGVTRWLGVVLCLLVLACLTDYLFDRYGYEDTPTSLRFLMFLAQVVVASGLGLWWILLPALRQPTEDELTLYVEDKAPHFHHRLITTVQLNQPGARKEGMSQELIDAVTRETEKQAEHGAFAALADHRRFWWSAGLGGPVLLVAVLLIVLIPLAPLLLARQLPWVDLELPRSVQVQSITKEIWPAGESVLLKFKVTGAPFEAYKKAHADVTKAALEFKKTGNLEMKNKLEALRKAEEEAIDALQALEGTALIQPKGLPRERYEIKYARPLKDGIQFTAMVPSTSVDFTFSARLGDGRTRKENKVTLVSRPVVTAVRAWVQLPTSCGLRPGGVSAFRGGKASDRRFELPPSGGDILAIPDCAARVEITLQKPVAVAALTLLGDQAYFDPWVQSAVETLPIPLVSCTLEAGAKLALRKAAGHLFTQSVPLKLDAAGTVASAAFPIAPYLTHYRIEAADEHHFTNNPKPTRTIKIISESAPQVTLLPTMLLETNRVSYTEEDLLEGMPIQSGFPIPVAYSATGPYGLNHAQLRYGFPKKTASGDTPAEDEVWEVLPLSEKKEGPGTGPFIPRVGRFLLSPDQIQFHAVPSPDPELLGRQVGGGHFMFETSKLYSQGKEIQLKAGDQIAFYVEVFAGRPGETRPSARSETRVVNVVTSKEWNQWFKELRTEQERVSKLYLKQKNVLDGP